MTKENLKTEDKPGGARYEELVVELSVLDGLRLKGIQTT